MKKRIIAVLLGLLICVSLGGCGTSSDTSTGQDDKGGMTYEYSSLDVLMMMFDKVGVKPYETINVLDEKAGEQQLNYQNMLAQNQEEIKAEGYISGATTVPMMMPSTQNITVLQFKDNRNFEKYKKAMKGIMYSGVCVSPSEESVHIIENGNFICYISVESHEGDRGDEFEKAFKELDLTVKPEYNDDTTLDKAMTIYNEHKENYDISELNVDPMSVYTINPSFAENKKYDFTEEDLEDGYFIRSKVDYSQLDKPLGFSAYVVKVKNPDKINLVKEAVEEASKVEGYENKFFISKDVEVKVEVEGNYVILIAKKDK
jgi:hypothetical protein